jgi:hypothetical protein
VDSVKDIIHNAILAQKRIASGWNVPEVYTQEFVNQSNEITKNITSEIDVSNQLTVKSLDAIVENFRIFKQTINSFTEFTSNATKA